MKIINYKITPEQMAEIEQHLQTISWLANRESLLDWKDLQTICRNVADVRQNLSWIKEKAEAQIIAGA